MHRHGYKGRKLGRERDERRNLIKGLATSLVRDESITTTLPKAKEVLPYVEKLITKAKKADLANKRRVIAGLTTKEAAFKLINDMAPKMNGRVSGHVRLEKAGLRRGDGSPMATLSFVDDLSEQKPAAKPKATKAADKPASKPAAAAKTAAKTAAKKTPAKKPAAKKPAPKKSEDK